MEHLKIIALMGKARSGKDTVGDMLVKGQGGVKMAFADKLKNIAAEMFCLPLEDLYTQEGKEKATKFPCLMCPTCHGVHVDPLDMPDSVPLATCKLCGSTGDLKVFKSMWTGRTVLQYLGTEGFRKIDPEVWVRYALDRARQLLDGAPIATPGVTPDVLEVAQALVARPLPRVASEAAANQKEAHFLARYIIAQTTTRRTAGTAAKFVVITDCRFKSEATAVLAAGGEVWRIKRPETDAKAEGLKGHASEVEQDSISDSECQAVIQNDGTLENLQGLVMAQLHRFLAKY